MLTTESMLTLLCASVAHSASICEVSYCLNSKLQLVGKASVVLHGHFRPNSFSVILHTNPLQIPPDISLYILLDNWAFLTIGFPIMIRRKFIGLFVISK